MSTIEILSLSTVGSQFSRKTSDILGVLRAWDEKGLITGEALCCVTSLTKGVGVVVSESTLASWQFTGSVTVGDSAGSSLTNLYDLSKLIARPSEIFMVRGPKILGEWDVWLFNRSGSATCKLAVSLL